MQFTPRDHVEVAGTSGVARHGLRSGRFACLRGASARLPQANRASTAFVTLNEQAHGCFDLYELAHAGDLAAR